MLRRLFLIPALAIAGIGVLASSVKAQVTTHDVTFSGNILPSACTWTTLAPGQLAANPTFDQLITGVPAFVDIECPTGATVTIADPVLVIAPIPMQNPTAWVQHSSGTAYSPQHPSNGVSPSIAIPSSVGIPESLSVSMEAFPIPPILAGGLYEYTVTLTATP